MSQSVDILIKADDKASQKVADAAINVDKSLRRVEQITSSLETPTEKYNRQLEDLALAHERGAVTAEQFAEAEGRLLEKIESGEASLGKIGDSAKTAAGGVAALASAAGSSELAGFVRQMGDVTDKVGEFKEVAKAGGAGAFAFKAGLVGLAATLGFKIGGFLGELIFQTEKWSKALDEARAKAMQLDASLKQSADARMSSQKAGIELISNPQEKQAAYKQLTDELKGNVDALTNRVSHSKKEVEAWNQAWQVTGNRKQYAVDAQLQLDKDRELLAVARELYAEEVKAKGLRELAEANAFHDKQIEAKQRSLDYLDSLRQELALLQATKEERRELEAISNTVEEDQGVAEALLKERDAIIAKAEAAKELEATQKRAQEEAAHAAERAKEDAAKEIMRVDQLIAAEQERQELQRIEIEQGKEAARVRELMNKGVDEATARQLAAEDTALDKLKQNGSGGKSQENLQASESRLLTRGAGSSPMEETNKILTEVSAGVKTLATYSTTQLEAQQQIAANTSGTTQVVVPQ